MQEDPQQNFHVSSTQRASISALKGEQSVPHDLFHVICADYLSLSPLPNVFNIPRSLQNTHLFSFSKYYHRIPPLSNMPDPTQDSRNRTSSSDSALHKPPTPPNPQTMKSRLRELIRLHFRPFPHFDVAFGIGMYHEGIKSISSEDADDSGGPGAAL